MANEEHLAILRQVVEVRQYFNPDFSRCQEPDADQAAFERLMRDLKLEA